MASQVRPSEEARPRTEPAGTTLARFCADLTLERIPAAARERTAELVLDLLGVAVRGSAAPSSQAVLEFVRTQPPGEATVLGRLERGVSAEGTDGIRTNSVVNATNSVGSASPSAKKPPLQTSAAWAALANGASAHAIEMDDVTTESSLHPGAAVIPAALAVAEEIATRERALGTTAAPGGPSQRKTGRDGDGPPLGARVIEAVVAGYEVTMRVGNALGAASSYERGFHPTGVAGVFGAAVAAGKLMRLDADGLARAMGIAGTMASGSLSYLDDGSWTKRLNPGWAAHGGVVAAGLASVGFTGPATALDGPHGLLRGYTDAPDPDRLTEGLGKDALQVMRVSLKPYGCCRYSHGLIDAMLALRAEHFAPPDRKGLPLTDIEQIRLGVLSGGWPLIAEGIERKRDPRNTVDAQFSAPYAAAVALSRGRAGMREFEIDSRDPSTGDQVMGDSTIRGLMAKTECYRDPSLDAEYPKSWPAAVEIRLRNGRVLRQRVAHALGEPESPVKREALVERFVEMIAPGLELDVQSDRAIEEVADLQRTARAAAERILHLEREPDLGVLAALA